MRKGHYERHKIEDLTIDSIKPLEPISVTSEPQQSIKELRLDEIEERLKQKMKDSDIIKNNENSSEVLKITSETLTMIRKVMDCIGRMEHSLNAKMAEKLTTTINLIQILIHYMPLGSNMINWGMIKQ